MPLTADQILAIRARVDASAARIVEFLRALCAIPSYDGQIGPVGERCAQEMRALGYDTVRFDRMGNILGRIGDGPRIFLYDSHLDTVGVGDPAAWSWDPFQGKIEDGILYARGACDEKGSTPGMIYGLAIARDLGLLDGYTAYYFGNMEEWCDGLAPQALVEIEGIRPDWVVIGEPTRLQVYRGHKGRVEMRAVAKGRSAHAASNHLGDNAIYKMLPLIAAVRDLEPALGDDPFLGHGKITVTDLRVRTASINAVPDECTIFLDRRLTFGETKEAALAQVQELIAPGATISVEILRYAEPSYTGFVLPVEKYFPPWALAEEHPLVQAGLATRWALGLPEARPGKWEFSTNGTYWMGKAGIPSIGFGPGDEVHAHTVLDQVALADVVHATEFYAALPGMVRG